MDLTTTEKPESAKQEIPVLGAYTDFRLYLKDFYEFKLRTQSSPVRPYSYAHFSAAANIKSPNYLKLIIDGKRNLSPAMARKFARALGLGKDQAEEFEALVAYGQARDPLERNRRLKTLSEWRSLRQRQRGAAGDEDYQKVPSWVTWALYALADQRGVGSDPQVLRDVLRGRANLDEIKRGLQSLVEAGEVKVTESGELKKGPVMKAPDEIPAAVVRKLQSELIYIGLESLFQDKPEEREIGALTLCLTKREFEDLKFELRHLRKRVLKDNLIHREREKGDRVYQLNIQLYPMSEATEPNRS
jgi:uncharacterized protein (TIGR02147 family)